MFIDGGVADPYGLVGLSSVMTNDGRNERIINLMVGDFHLSTAPGPSSSVLKSSNATVLSISVQNLPQCGPWAMGNGPIAVELAKQAIEKAMDVPLWNGAEDNHYELHIDASYFVN
jgi:hypothetical protein